MAVEARGCRLGVVRRRSLWNECEAGGPEAMMRDQCGERAGAFTRVARLTHTDHEKSIEAIRGLLRREWHAKSHADAHGFIEVHHPANRGRHPQHAVRLRQLVGGVGLRIGPHDERRRNRLAHHFEWCISGTLRAQDKSFR